MCQIHFVTLDGLYGGENMGIFWVDLSKHNPRLIQFLHTLEIAEPLDLRDAFYGGRTGATCLYHKTNEAQGEKYITPMSLLNIRR